MDRARTRLQFWLDAIDRTANRFDPSSEISRINASVGPTKVSPDFVLLLEAATRAFERSAGLCDPTIGASLVALGYDRDFDTLTSSDVPVAAPLPAPGLGAIDFDARTAILHRPQNVRLDFGSVAKALCCDLVASDIAPTGGVVVEIGGDVAVRAATTMEPWVIGIADQLHLTGHEPRIGFVQGGIATSSRAVRTWERAGQRYHHIIDPRTGRCSEGPYVTATVSAADCVTANAFATAALIAGDDAPYAIAQAGWSGRLVRTDGTIEYVGAWPPEENE